MPKVSGNALEVAMYIECPSCNTDNEIEFAKNIKCSKCKESFAGHSYRKFKKPLISATTALVAGGFFTYQADKLIFEEERYPLKVEYELVDSCVNSSRIWMSTDRHIKKTQLCICALEETMKVISYKELEKSEPEFLARFKGNIADCQ